MDSYVKFSNVIFNRKIINKFSNQLDAEFRQDRIWDYASKLIKSLEGWKPWSSNKYGDRSRENQNKPIFKVNIQVLWKLVKFCFKNGKQLAGVEIIRELSWNFDELFKITEKQPILINQPLWIFLLSFLRYFNTLY